MHAENELILAEEFCSYYKIDYSFINTLQQYGLVEITAVDAANYIPHTQLQKLEQIIRLYYELNINLEGIDAIDHLLDKVKSMQSEIIFLKNQLKQYETPV